jgi:hypothetical protein
MLWELLAGRPAVIDGKAVEVLEQVIEETPPALATIDPGLPRPISDVIMKGLAKEVEDRWQSAASYRDALTIAVRPLGATTPVQMGAFVRETFPPERQAYARWTRAVAKHADGLADAPTIADGTLTAYDLMTMPTSHAAQTPVTSSQPDKTPPLEVLPSGSEITRPDLPYKDLRAYDKVHELSARVRSLEATVRRQRRMITLLALLLISIGGLLTTLVQLPRF